MKLGRTALGDIVPAMYPLPANPVMLAYYAEQQAIAASAKKGMGIFVPAVFNEPENPVQRGMTVSSSNALSPMGSFEGPKSLVRPKRNAVAVAHATMKASGPTSSGVVNGVNGLGDLDLSSFTNFVNSISSGTCTTPGSTCFATSSFGGNIVLFGGIALLVVLASRRGR